MTKETHLTSEAASSVINHNKKASFAAPGATGPSTGTSSRRPRSSGNGKSEAASGSSLSSCPAEVIIDEISKHNWIKDQQPNNSQGCTLIALDDLGASALPSKKATTASRPRKLQLQFSIQDKSEDEDECVFLDNHEAFGGLSEEDEEATTTSPSLTFGGHNSCSSALQKRRTSSAEDTAQSETELIVGGAKKKCGHAYSGHRRKRRKASSAVRIENGEIRPLRGIDEGLIEDEGAACIVTSRRTTESNRRRRSRVDIVNGSAPPPGPGQVGGPSKSMDKDELNHIIPESKKFPQIAAAVSVSTGCISYGICIAYTSPAIPSILELNQTTSLTNTLGDEETSWMSSLLALGALFGSLSAVYLMDAVGRKASLLAFSVMSLFIGWTLLMAASQVWQLYTGRFLLGLGAGMEITICPVYIQEICRPALRDVCGSFPQVFIALGILICYIMGRSLEWNWLALAACLFLFPFVFGLYFIPESPPWLIYNDEEDLAYKSMLMIRGEEYDASVEIFKIKDNLARNKNDLHAMLLESVDYLATNNTNSDIGNNSSILEYESGSRKSSSAVGSTRSTYKQFGFRDVLQKSVLYPFLVILVLMVLLQFSGQGAITFYTALIFEEAESSVDPNDCALVIGVTYFLSSILGLVLKKHVGRRVLLLASELGMALSQLAMGIYFYVLTGTSTADLKKGYSGLRMLPLPILIIYTLAFNVGMGSLTWVVATEILPVRSRRWTHTVANVTSNFCWFVVTKTYKDISTQLGLSVPFFLYGTICMFGFIFIYVFLPETRGKTPEETAKAFRGWGPLMKRTGCMTVCHCCFQPLSSPLPAMSADATTADHEGTPVNNQLKTENHNNCEAAINSD